ncbi:MAG: energy transducer TonB [Vicinamibacterales bacterium]
MFDLYTGRRSRSRDQRTGLALTVSTIAHASVLAVLIGASLVAAGREVPHVAGFVKLVAELPAPPPDVPPPPAAAPRPKPAPSRAVSTPHAAPPVVPPQTAAPAVAPSIAPETAASAVPAVPSLALSAGHGTAGGWPALAGSGVAGGAGTATWFAPPPPPVVRIGGQLKAPDLVRRVAPVYPTVARLARVHGDVVVDAKVGTDGHVESVRVIKSVPLLDDAAVAAVRQWQYSPLRLNGTPVSFELAVTVSFSVHG